jgi:hypothetical protein
VSGVELRADGAGEYGDDQILIFTETELRAAPKLGDVEADKITWQGDLYQIVRCKRWDALGEVHFEATGAKLAMP